VCHAPTIPQSAALKMAARGFWFSATMTPGFLDPDGVVEGAANAHGQGHEGRNGPPADAHLDVVREPPGVYHVTGGSQGST
jgi:hypothetical protein